MSEKIKVLWVTNAFGCGGAERQMLYMYNILKEHTDFDITILYYAQVGDALNIDGYWVLVAITSLINIIMYLFMFSAFLKLRVSQADKPRPFKLPGGKVGAYIVGGVAIITLVFGFIFGLYPSNPLSDTMTVVYIIGVFLAVVCISILPPFIISKWFKKDSWMPTEAELEEYEKSVDN